MNIIFVSFGRVFIILVKTIVSYKGLAYRVVGGGARVEGVAKIMLSVIIIFTCK